MPRLLGRGAHEATYHLAVICRKSGKIEKAWKYIEEALKNSPGNETYEMERGSPVTVSQHGKRASNSNNPIDCPSTRAGT